MTIYLGLDLVSLQKSQANIYVSFYFILKVNEKNRILSTGQKLTFISEDLARIGIRKKRVGRLDTEGREINGKYTNEAAFTTF